VHDRVARQHGRQSVAERERERVVPRGDDADDPLGDPVDLDPGQARDHAGDPLRVEVLVSRAAVVAGGQRDVHRLVVRVLAGLAGLPADHVADLRLPLEQQVVQPQHRSLALVDAGSGPLLLSATGAAERLRDVVGGGLRDHADRLAVERAVRRDALAARGDQPVGESADEGRFERVGGGRVRRGVPEVGVDVAGRLRIVVGTHIPRVCDGGLRDHPSTAARTRPAR
jgi:hypothetical protein